MNNILDLYNKIGNSFYILDTKVFEKNYKELKQSMQNYYKNSNIAYSYKTNYIPRLCSIVSKLGGYAEVVSKMEYNISQQLGIEKSKVAYNGPVKDKETLREIVVNSGIINIDSQTDYKMICEIASEEKKVIEFGIRCNFDIGDNVISRFGFDIDSKSIWDMIIKIKNNDNLKLVGPHCHFASRSLKWWNNRAVNIIALSDKIFTENDPKYICLGGGLYGRMEDSLKLQFSDIIPTYDDYAREFALPFKERYGNDGPELLVEPGSALAGDSMRFVTSVCSIKNVRGKDIATLNGSIYNINPTLNTKNPPITVYSMKKNIQQYNSIDFAGYTCIESDYMYRGYKGKLSEGDIVEFKNIGSYSIVLKPPFIFPNFPVIEIFENNKFEIIKREETYEDIFQTYNYEVINDL